MKQTLFGIWLLVCAMAAIASAAAPASQQNAQMLQSEATHSFRLSYQLFLPADYGKNAARDANGFFADPLFGHLH